LVVYFSGHANPRGLELGSEVFSFSELKQRIARAPSEVKVAIVDACDSGALTQVKGGRPTPSLDFPLPGDDAVEGVAFVASTAVGELAQESRLLGASFFSHHLEVGLRGAADTDGDGRVTLGEAFRYTSTRTVAGTAATKVGTQHPTYEVRMSGRGEVVLADLRRAEASLTLPADPQAFYLFTGPQGLVAEVQGGELPVTIALPAGDYRLERRGQGLRKTAEFELRAGESRSLPQLSAAPFEIAQSKGVHRAFELSVGFGGGLSVLPSAGASLSARVGVSRALGPVALKARLDGTRKDGIRDDALLYDCWSLGLTAGGWLPVLQLGRVEIELGVEGGYAILTQTLQTGARFQTGVFRLGLGAAASFRVGPARFGLEAGGMGNLLQLNERAAARFTGDVAFVAGYGV
jgi:hypothetical protein